MNKKPLLVMVITALLVGGVISNVHGSTPIIVPPVASEAMTRDRNKKLQAFIEAINDDPYLLDCAYRMTLSRKSVQPVVLEAVSSIKDRTFKVKACELSPADVRAITSTILHYDITTLNITDCYLNNVIMTQLLTGIEGCSRLTTLNLHNRLDENCPERRGVIPTEGANALKNLLLMGNIKTLDLTRNKIEGVDKIVEGLNALQLTSLSLVGCDMNARETSAIISALSKPKIAEALQTLKIGISSEVVGNLCVFMNVGRELSHLIIEDCGIKNAAGNLLADTLARALHIRRFDILQNKNEMGDIAWIIDLITLHRINFEGTTALHESLMSLVKPEIKILCQNLKSGSRYMCRTIHNVNEMGAILVTAIAKRVKSIHFLKLPPTGECEPLFFRTVPYFSGVTVGISGDQLSTTPPITTESCSQSEDSSDSSSASRAEDRSQESSEESFEGDSTSESDSDSKASYARLTEPSNRDPISATEVMSLMDTLDKLSLDEPKIPQTKANASSYCSSFTEEASDKSSEVPSEHSSYLTSDSD